ncbi:alpha/beta hydrolase [Sphingobium sp. HBC34]|uniref:Alpha/beta hydrolase n=1 Tax=Sphingobium cyanobacteriorum TaxID=3063954 RepID=A0ABT8ZFW0_9SPHN|nr:alpha/beta hydrolase [Sphingobium sp. HBC34]MDO7833429.1 alpha/beta hydrolase [Sphingobium sp. HBC34]
MADSGAGERDGPVVAAGRRSSGACFTGRHVGKVMGVMTVDRDFQAILDVINAMPPTDFSRPPADLAQEMRSAPVMIPPLRNPVSVEVRKVPAGDGHAVPVRIYRPSSPRPHAVLISMHGGGWVRGSLDADEFRCHLIAHDSGCAVVSVDYRLAPEYPFPVPLEDCLAVTEWVAAQAAALGFDPDRIGIAGDSAGGNLATAVAMIARDRGGPDLQCQILLYPVCDHDFDRPSYLENAQGKLLTRAHMMWFWDQYAGQADRNQAHLSPLRADDLRGLPPTLLITVEHDPLRDEGELYASRLREAGNQVESLRMDGLIHAFQSVAVQHPRSIESLKIVTDFAKRHLGHPA